MTDQQIINALRVCADPGEDCDRCPYFTKANCSLAARLDAADRLEELCRGGSEKNDHIR